MYEASTCVCQKRSDTFHKDVPFEKIKAAFEVMASLPQHTFQVLTKRSDRMVEFFKWYEEQGLPSVWPLPNVWLGVTVENQASMKRVEHLVTCPAQVRFLSCEPLLGSVVLQEAVAKNLHWIIVGGESGTFARPMDENWVRELRDQASTYNIPFFYKQRVETDGSKIGLPELDGVKWAQYPIV